MRFDPSIPSAGRLALRSLLVSLSLTVVTHGQDLRLPSIFSDHMVLQRDRDVAVWGWAKPGSDVVVKATWGSSGKARAGRDGRWKTTVRTPGAGAGHGVTVTAGDESIQYGDVLLGDVWLCSGQSNMEMPVGDVGPGYRGAKDYERELEDAHLPRMRLFTVQNAISPAPETDVTGSWTPATKESVYRFSATGFFFGKKIHRELGIPIGLVSADWGGTVCESWTSREALEAHGGFEDGLAMIDRLRRGSRDDEKRLSEARARWWARHDEDVAWTAADFDDTSWSDLAVPGIWERTDVGDFDGFLFMRRAVVLPEEAAGKELILELGPVDDMDTTWFNGTRVGGMERPGVWNVPRRYVIPGSLVRAGKNVVAVRCLDTGGAGGFAGAKEALSLRRGDGAGDRVGLAGTWKARKGPAAGSLPRFPTGPAFHANVPTALFNGMIAPLIPYGIRGFLWYQGESNRTRALQYRTLFPAMITDWRRRFGQGDRPFYYVQIAPFRYRGDTGAAAELREAQFMALRLPNTGMAVTMDIGNPRDIHPNDKQEVGRRLARWALVKEYGKRGIAWSGPLYTGMTIEGGAIRLHFDHAEGLKAKGGSPSHFTIAGRDGKFTPARARIDGRTVIVSSPRVPSPLAVRYAWGPADEPNLFNGAGLPASSFRTDDLPRSLQRR